MHKILITGGLGRLGRPVLSSLLLRGHQIRALRLPQEPLPLNLDSTIEIVLGDVSDLASLQKACRGVTTVIHLAGLLQAKDEATFKRVNTLGTQNMVQASEENNVSHFIHISSISVTYPLLSPYAASKMAAEKTVAHSRLPGWTVIRPTLIYDDCGGGLEFAALVRWVARYPWLLLPEGGKALKRPLWAQDAGELLAQLPGEARSFGKTYALAGEETLTLATMASRIAMGLGMRRRLVSVPRSWATVGATLAQWAKPGRSVGKQGLYGLLQDAAPDIEALKRDFSYSPQNFQVTPRTLEMAAGLRWQK